MTWLVVLGFFSLGFSLGVCFAGVLSHRSFEDATREAFLGGQAYGLAVALDATREAQDDFIGAAHRKAQIDAAREGRQ